MGNSNSQTPLNSVTEEKIPFPNKPKGIEVAFSTSASSSVGDSPTNPKLRIPVPCVFRWENPRNETVYVSGEWDNFQSKHKLVRTDSAHTLILEVPSGQHRYRFEVDGQWTTDPEKRTISSHRGETFNVVVAEQVGEFTMGDKGMATESSSPQGEYGQEVRDPPPDMRAKRKGNLNDPPMLPPHLLRALLNTPQPTDNPLLLPLPHHVMLNHLYINKSRDRDDVVIYGITCRYRTKFVTTCVYLKKA